MKNLIISTVLSAGLSHIAVADNTTPLQSDTRASVTSALSVSAPSQNSHNKPESVRTLAIQGDIYDIGVKVFEKLRRPGESISFSPTSLQQILYIYTLSHGHDALAKKLGFTGEDKTKFESLLKRLNAPDAEPFKSFNAAFRKLGTFGNEKFLKELGVELGKINSSDIPGETARLNKFVSDQTNLMIKDLFQPTDISAAQEIFVNTMHFKGEWSSAFKDENTKKDQDFGNGKKAHLMNQTSKYSTAKTETATVVKLPFKDGSSMIAFLPDNSLEETIQEANRLLKTNDINFGKPTKIEFTFPKFDIESTANGIGKELGIDVNIKQISRVIVNEQGAEAAAGTAARTRSIMIDVINKLKFNKPFYYVIQDKDGNVHFMGTYEGK